jgi:hypothetical protein
VDVETQVPRFCSYLVLRGATDRWLVVRGRSGGLVLGWRNLMTGRSCAGAVAERGDLLSLKIIAGIVNLETRTQLRVKA